MMTNHFFTVTVLLVICLCALSCVNALNYSDLQAIPFQNCPRKNRCSLIGNATFNDRLCECDNSCASFGDCCIDVARSNSRRPSRQTCMHYGNFTHQGVYVINTCSNGYLGPDEVIHQCMRDNFSDPLVSAPVTDTRTRNIYLNRYCAICNDVSPTSMTTWKIYLACGDDLDTGDVSWNTIKYRPDLKRWGYQRYGVFNPCKFIYDKPESLSVTGRPCRSNVISSCPGTRTHQNGYWRECESYMAVVTDSANNAYKNPHCARCHHVRDEDLMCLLTSIFDRAKVNFSFALLVDVNRRDGDIVGVSRSSEECPNGQKYDPYFKKCRILRCGIPGYTMVNGKCAKQ